MSEASAINNKPISTRAALIYSIGTFAGGALGVAGSLKMPIFQITVGIDIALLAVVVAVLRLLDAFTDPLIAQWTDNFYSRWGRRRPFIIVGGIGMGFFFSLMWMFPTDWSPNAILIWYIVCSALLSVFSTAFGSAYGALGVEIAPNYAERTRITAFKSYFGKIFGLINPWAFRATQMAVFGSALVGARWIGAVYGFIIIVSSIVAGIYTEERFADINKKTGKTKLNLLRAVLETTKNKYFWMLTVSGITLSTGLILFDGFGLYVNIYYVAKGDKLFGSELSAYAGMVAVALGILIIPFIWKACDKFGKHQTMRYALLWMALGSFLKFWLYSPEYPYLQLLVPFFYSLGIGSFYLILNALWADVIDVDELQTGFRREAMFGAITSWIQKLATAGAVAMSGWIIKSTGFIFEKGGDQLPEVFFKMRICYSFASGFCVLLALLSLLPYNLTRERCEIIRLELERRREEK